MCLQSTRTRGFSWYGLIFHAEGNGEDAVKMARSYMPLIYVLNRVVHIHHLCTLVVKNNVGLPWPSLGNLGILHTIARCWCSYFAWPEVTSMSWGSKVSTAPRNLSMPFILPVLLWADFTEPYLKCFSTLNKYIQHSGIGNRTTTSSHGTCPSFLDAKPGTSMSALSSTCSSMRKKKPKIYRYPDSADWQELIGCQ